MKLQTIVITKMNLQNNCAILSINNVTIKSKEYMKLPRVTIDDKRSFENHINKLYRLASFQWKTIFKLKFFKIFQPKKLLIETFVYLNFNYCPLVWHIRIAKSLQKIGIFKTELYNTCMMILGMVTLNYCKHQAKLLWQLKDLVCYVRNLQNTQSTKPRIFL